MRKRFLLITLLMLGALPAHAQEILPIWPEGTMPNSRGVSVEDSMARQRIFQIAEPELHAFFPPQEKNERSAVVILPGGGYHHLTYVLGGTQLAKWFNTLGVNAFVLNYRLPHSPDLEDRALGPLQDAQRAMRLVRARAEEWDIDPDKVGVMGSSAGGHLASTLATHARDVSAIGDALDAEPFAPDFLILLSSVITMGEGTHEGSRRNLLGKDPSREQIRTYSSERQVTAATPPTFLVHAADDEAVDPMNSISFYEALLAHGVAASLHVFARGGHAIGLRGNPAPTELWTVLCEEWLRERGLLTTEAPGAR